MEIKGADTRALLVPLILLVSTSLSYGANPLSSHEVESSAPAPEKHPHTDNVTRGQTQPENPAPAGGIPQPKASPPIPQPTEGTKKEQSRPYSNPDMFDGRVKGTVGESGGG